ncbi:MAG: carboxyl-terminal protease [Bacilli bacterium]|nr:carboxyl-terminal protease [Bacilli bacterium]
MQIKKSTFILTNVFTLLAGGSIAAGYMHAKQTGSQQVVGSAALQGANAAEVKKLQDTYSILKQQYVSPTDDQKLIDGAINGMITALGDPFSTYMDAGTATQFHNTLSSSFEGIGAEIEQNNGKIVVKSPIKGSPADKAGIRTGDAIRKVDGKSIDGLSADQAVLLIRGKKGTAVQLDLSHPGSDDLVHLTITRDTIPQETVYGELLPGDAKIGKIIITQFSDDTAAHFHNALTSLETQGMKGLIIDLRDNPGGLLNSVSDISNELIPNQKTIVQIEDRTGHRDIYKSKLTTAKPYPIVALVNGGSASAAEILAAALKESAGDKLVGEKTYGKGTVQTTYDFKDGSNIKYTIAKWLTPNANWIHKIGILPDVPVAMPDYFAATNFPQNTNLKLDENDAQVKNLQLILAGVGDDPGRKDGYFDQKTEEMVKSFQTSNGLPVTGVVNDQTATALMDALHVKAQNDDTQLAKAETVLQEEMK